MNLTVHLTLVPAVSEADLDAVREMVERTVRTSVLGRVVSAVGFDDGDGDIRVTDVAPNPDLPPASDGPLLQPTPVPVG